MNQPFGQDMTCIHGVQIFAICDQCYADEVARDVVPLTADKLFVTTSAAQLENTLQQRHERYGTYLDTATLITDLKEVMHAQPSWDGLEADQKESLDLIANKIGRILRGDANYVDSWHDIAGYATLIEKRLNGEHL